jgi:hypothetical protein
MRRHCAALRPPRKFQNIWMPCERRPVRGDAFCARHRTALDGAVLGLVGAEPRQARALAKIHYKSEIIDDKERKTYGDKKNGRKKQGREKRALDVAVCPSCGALWDAEEFVRRMQLAKAEKEYLFEAVPREPARRQEEGGAAPREAIENGERDRGGAARRGVRGSARRERGEAGSETSEPREARGEKKETAADANG